MNPIAASLAPRSQVAPLGSRLAVTVDGQSVMPNSKRACTVGLLALQGDFGLHGHAIQSLGHRPVEVRTVEELATVDCLIMPGGESTTMRKLMRSGGLFEAIPRFAESHPIMATCAGLILLSRGVNGDRMEETLDLIDCTVSRNAYGRQYHSFRQQGTLRLPEGETQFEMVFIRAPQIVQVGKAVEILGRLGDEPTMIRQGNILAMTFHPELSGDGRIHKYFASMMS